MGKTHFDSKCPIQPSCILSINVLHSIFSATKDGKALSEFFLGIFGWEQKVSSNEVGKGGYSG